MTSTSLLPSITRNILSPRILSKTHRCDLVVACQALAATLLLVWPLVFGQAGFVEANDGVCPAVPQVEQRVRSILGLKPGDALEERATSSREGEALKIVVRRKD